MNELRSALAGVPDAEVPRTDEIARAIDQAVAFLGSDEAIASLSEDPYWPKWESPWWQMLLLHELGEARRIPARAVAKMIEAMNGLPLHIFPIQEEDTPDGVDPYRGSACHCSLGSIYQVLAACGVDPDRALPWAAPWFPRYQMADGGMNCDGEAYLQIDEVPSSMVGTVAPLEAMLLGDPATWPAERRAFVDRAAGFLIERRLMLGSSTRHNAEERTSALAWPKPTFPRLYFYDVIRGVAALVTWAERTGRSLPRRAVSAAIDHLTDEFPDGVVRVQRRAFDNHTTHRRTGDDGEWQRGQPTGTFPLLDATSVIGDASEALTRQWAAARRGLIRLIDAGRIA